MDPYELVNAVKEEFIQAEAAQKAWDACYENALKLAGGSVTKHQFTLWCRSRRDEMADQGYYEAANVYRQMLSLLAVK
jgi:hypothetical protein